MNSTNDTEEQDVIEPSPQDCEQSEQEIKAEYLADWEERMKTWLDLQREWMWRR